MNAVNKVPDMMTVAGKGKSYIFGAIGLGVLLLLANKSMYTVDEGNVGIVKRFGEATQQDNPGLHVKIPFVDTIVKGDQLSQSISAASVLAKVTRDRIMVEYHKSYPQYGFDKSALQMNLLLLLL